MPNPNQVGNSEPNQNAENGFVKMAHEVPNFEDHIKQYEATHPDAVKDIEKARVMAEAGNFLETEAANEKLNALNALDNGDEFYESANKIGTFTQSFKNNIFKKPIEDAPKNIKKIKDTAAKTEESAGQHYDKQQQLREDIKNS